MTTTVRPNPPTSRDERPPAGRWLFCMPRGETDCESPTAMFVAEHSFWLHGRASLAMRYGAVVSAVARALRDDDPTLGPMHARQTAHRRVMRALAATDTPLRLDRPDCYPFTTLRGIRA